MEALLHYIWKNKLYDSSNLYTTDRKQVIVIDPGTANTDAGPDFFNAKIKIEDQVWAGNIEIHTRSSDWIKHGHKKNKAYNSVILHVVKIPDQTVILRENGESIPQLVIPVPDTIRKNYEYLSGKDLPVACVNRISEIPALYITDWLSFLVNQRLEKKNDDLNILLETHKNDWAEAFYITLSRNFGFGINSDAFERLAKSLPIRYIFKHKDSLMQVEALFFGQAGLLEEDIKEDNYYSSLQKEYRFFQKKYKLKPLEPAIFKNLRIRPVNFPHIKIAQLASLIKNQEYLFSKVLNTEDINELRALFISNISDYWKTHYHFGKTSSNRIKSLGKTSLEIILINTVVPILFTYGKQKDLPELTTKAIRLLETIQPEKNTITTLFGRTGIRIQNAADSQALIQLKREYCEKKKCIFCRIGHKLLSKS